MKYFALVAIVLCLLVVIASAHPHKGKHKGRPHGEGHHHNKEDHQPICQYKNTQGHSFDFSRLSSRDLLVKDMIGGSTYHLNPCGPVHDAECPKGAAVCEITNKGIAITHGLANDAHWADGAGSGASVEIIYGSGELCAQGQPRKAVVEMRCLASSNPSSPSFLMGIIKEDCLLKLIVESPLACDRQAICSALTNEASCQVNHDLCEWNAGVCVPSSDEHRWGGHVGVTAFIISALVGFSAVICLGCSVFCACLACRRAIRRRKLRRGLPILKKKAKKAKKSEKAAVAVEELSLITPENSEPVVLPDAHFPFQPFAMHQAPDGSFVPVPMPMPMPGQPTPYAYSYPMVQVIPAYHVQHPAQQQ